MIDEEGTRIAFSGLIDKPELTDALLSRPPFKFILDVIVNTITRTGYLKAEFPKEELDKNKLSDKEAKCNFLDKFIAAVNDGSLGHVRSAKIVAGKEPEATCLLLKLFANKARQFKESNTTKKKSSSKSKETKNKDKSDSSAVKTKQSNKENVKDEEKSKKSRSRSKDVKESKKDRSKSKDKNSEEKSKKSSKASKDRKTKERKHDSVESAPSTSQTEVSEKEVEVVDEGFSDQSVAATKLQQPNGMLGAAKPDDSGVSDISESPRPPPAEEREQIRPGTSAARPMTSMGRPGTAAARPAPPKLKKKHIATTDEPVQPVSEPIVDILVETEAGTADEYMIEEPIHEDSSLIETKHNVQIEGEMGGLVQKMMETKAGLEEGLVDDDNEITDGELARQKTKVESLQSTLQNVTRTTYPLARLFDYAQEDLESMIRELEKWRAEARSNEFQLKDREASGHGDSNKLANMVHQLDSEIRDVKNALSAAKGRIVANEEKINILVSGL